MVWKGTVLPDGAPRGRSCTLSHGPVPTGIPFACSCVPRSIQTWGEWTSSKLPSSLPWQSRTVSSPNPNQMTAAEQRSTQSLIGRCLFFLTVLLNGNIFAFRQKGLGFLCIQALGSPKYCYSR